MTMPQAQEPSAEQPQGIQIQGKYMNSALRQKLAAVEEENLQLLALHEQTVDYARTLETQLAEYQKNDASKESDGAGASGGEVSDSSATEAGTDGKRNGRGSGGPSPADAARAARKRQ